MTSSPEQSGSFEVVRRGYARAQVEAALRDLEQRVVAAENARRMAEQHAASATQELRQVKAATPVDGLPAVPESFGLRAERVLRLAEHEASEIRAAAGRDAAATRQAVAREIEAGREAADRAAAEVRAAAAREAAEVRAAATREAAELMGRAHTDAAAARAEAAAGRAALAAERESLTAERATSREQTAGLEALRVGIRGELARLHAVLGAELRGIEEPAAAAGQPAVPVAPPVVPPQTRPDAEQPHGDAAAPRTGGDTAQAEPAVDAGPRPWAAGEQPGFEASRTQFLKVIPAASDAPGPGGAGSPEPHTGPDRSEHPVWTPTPGTADLFANTPTDVRVPAQRTAPGADAAPAPAEDATPPAEQDPQVPGDPDGNRHALRTG